MNWRIGIAFGFRLITLIAAGSVRPARAPSPWPGRHLEPLGRRASVTGRIEPGFSLHPTTRRGYPFRIRFPTPYDK